MPDLVLYQPDIPGNTGTLLRLAACLGFKLHLIEPAGFRLDDKSLKRAGMDYVELAVLQKHVSYDAFEAWRRVEKRRLLLFTTKGSISFTEQDYVQNDLLMLGRESSGVPDHVHRDCDGRIKIPMNDNRRSINMALSGAMAISEALRQTGSFH